MRHDVISEADLNAVDAEASPLLRIREPLA